MEGRSLSRLQTFGSPYTPKNLKTRFYSLGLIPPSALSPPPLLPLSYPHLFNCGGASINGKFPELAFFPTEGSKSKVGAPTSLHNRIKTLSDSSTNGEVVGDIAVG